MKEPCHRYNSCPTVRHQQDPASGYIIQSRPLQIPLPAFLAHAIVFHVLQCSSSSLCTHAARSTCKVRAPPNQRAQSRAERPSYRYVQDLARTGKDEVLGDDPTRLASAASARRVVQQPDTMPGMQCLCSGERGCGGPRKVYFGDAGGLSSASAALAASGASSMHWLTSASIPFCSAAALDSKSFHKAGPQKGSSSSVFFMTWDQKSKMGRCEVLFCWWRVDES